MTILALMPSVSFAAQGLLTCGRCIGTTLTASSGIGTAKARIRSEVREADVAEYCEREVGDPTRLLACLADTRKTDLGTALTASADCTAGRIRNVDDADYRIVGIWGREDPTGVAIGTPKFSRADGSIVSTDHASGGRELATNWLLLCGDKVPAATKGAVKVSAAAGDVLGEPFMHNGSMMTIDVHSGTIAYAEPKSAIRRSVPKGAILFRGDMSNPRRVHGTAFTFRYGCEPAAYDVTGAFADGYASTLTLRGRAPVRAESGCAITGYSTSSPNSRLIFKYETPPEL
ncbi:hypothetical protein [uncultured Aureimonas sp.]|uniref:hypothetical protein n=1 Tax=uncultured Aureimonas sp. TaxID=1604662 RepID=UPI0025D82D3E|nr:hypothetical protein [uncultured Aureimonas sp.]